jgi:hypothetical protein
MRTQSILRFDLFPNLTFPLANESDWTDDESCLGKLVYLPKWFAE